MPTSSGIIGQLQAFASCRWSATETDQRFVLAWKTPTFQCEWLKEVVPSVLQTHDPCSMWLQLCKDLEYICAPKTEGSVWLKQRMHKEAWFPCHVLRSLFQMCDLILSWSFHRAGTAKSLDSLKGPKVSKSHIGRLIFSSHPSFESLRAKPYII